ncbi:MAG: ankyrin repeat domain-containing protein [Chthonomonadales bacterium]
MKLRLGIVAINLVCCVMATSPSLAQHHSNQMPEKGKSHESLGESIRDGSVNLLEKYLKRGGDPNTKLGGETLLTIASTNSNIDGMKALLKAGAKINNACEDGDTPLMRATRYLYRNEMDGIKLLISKGADVNKTFPKGTSALMLASAAPGKHYEALYVEAVKLFLKHGAKVNAKNGKGYSALKLAQEGEAKQIVSILKAAGAK